MAFTAYYYVIFTADLSTLGLPRNFSFLRRQVLAFSFTRAYQDSAVFMICNGAKRVTSVLTVSFRLYLFLYFYNTSIIFCTTPNFQVIVLENGLGLKEFCVSDLSKKSDQFSFSVQLIRQVKLFYILYLLKLKDMNFYGLTIICPVGLHNL